MALPSKKTKTLKLILPGDPEPPPSKTVEAFLISTPHGIEIHCKDENDNEWFLACLNTEGKLYLYSSVPEDIGFQVTEGKGFLEVEYEGGAD